MQGHGDVDLKYKDMECLECPLPRDPLLAAQHGTGVGKINTSEFKHKLAFFADTALRMSLLEN